MAFILVRSNAEMSLKFAKISGVVMWGHVLVSNIIPRINEYMDIEVIDNCEMSYNLSVPFVMFVIFTENLQPI